MGKSTSSFYLLKDYAEDQGARVEFSSDLPILFDDGAGCFELSSNTIYLNTNLKLRDESTWYVLAHEIGHYLDIKKNGKDCYDIISAAYIIMDVCKKKGTSTPKEVIKAVIAAEMRADRNAKCTLKELGISIPKEKLDLWIGSSRDSYEILGEHGTSWKSRFK